MAERKFTRGLSKPGSAAQVRETVSQVVRQSAVLAKPQLVEPIDYETFIAKNKTILQNDPHRDMLLYPNDDVSQSTLPRRCRTVTPIAASKVRGEVTNRFVLECIKTYTACWNLVHYKYSAYSGCYLQLPRIPKPDCLEDHVYEVDTLPDENEEENLKKGREITKQGYLLKGPESGNETFITSIATKSFKRRYVYLRREVDDTYILEFHKDDKKADPKFTICMEFCNDIIRNSKRGKFSFDLKMQEGHKSFILAAENEAELEDWLEKLKQIIHNTKQAENNRKLVSEQRGDSPPNTPEHGGTLKSLEHSRNPELMKYAKETVSSIAAARKECRQNLFAIYPEMPKDPEVIQEPDDIEAEPYKEQFGTRFVVRADAIKFELQVPSELEHGTLCQVEPYITTMALFDAKHGKKISEDFRFDVNHPYVRGMLPKLRLGQRADSFRSNGSAEVANGKGDDDFHHSSKTLPLKSPVVMEDWLAFPRQAVFNVTHVNPEIYLVIKIEKVLQGAISQAVEPYLRINKNGDLRTGCKVNKNARASCLRLGQYRMPFAWAAKPVFRQFTGQVDTFPDITAIYKQEGSRLSDEDLMKYLAEWRKPDKKHRLTLIPGFLKIAMEPLDKPITNCLTSSLVPLRPFPMPPTHSPTFEVEEFPSETALDSYPYISYTNFLYISPKSLQYETQKSFVKARNIACLIEFRDSDAQDALPIQCIYGRPGESLLTNQARCAVTHHSTNPLFYEEVKIDLPAQLHEKHHVLFTFLHVSCEPPKSAKKKDQQPVESPVGYAWYPILQNGRLMIEELTLPVAVNLPSGYLACKPLGLGKGYCGPEIRWVEGQKSLFKFDLKLNSTVYTKDKHLQNFFAHIQKLLESKIASSDTETCKNIKDNIRASTGSEIGREISKYVKAMHAIDCSTLIGFLPTILNQLFNLLVSDISEDIALEVVRVLIHIVHTVYEVRKLDILHSYVKFVFVTEPVSSNRKSTIHEELAKSLIRTLRPANTDFLVINKFLRHSWFFFQILVKSMSQHLLNTGRIKMHRHERFPPDYQFRIQGLLNGLMPHIIDKYKELPEETRLANRSLAYFMKKCLTFMDRGFVFKLINFYVDKFNLGDPKLLQEYKFDFLQIVMSHEHYISLNLPVMRGGSRRGVQRNMKDEADVEPDLEHEYRLSEEFCRNHFLVGVLLQEVKLALNEVRDVRKIAVNVLRNLLAKHAFDDRYQTKAQQAKIASLYLPFITVILENLNRLNCPENATASSSSTSTCNGSLTGLPTTPIASHGVTNSVASLAAIATPLTTQRLIMHRYTMGPDMVTQQNDRHRRDSSYLSMIAGQANVGHSTLSSGASSTSLNSSSSTLSAGSNQETEKETGTSNEGKSKIDGRPGHNRSQSVPLNTVRYDKLTPTEVKDLLICFLYIVKNVNEELLIGWWQQCSDFDILDFFQILEISLQQFKYLGKKQIVNTSKGETQNGATPKSMTLPARIVPPHFSNGGSRTMSSCSETTAMESSGDADSRHRALLEANIATEIGFITLDLLGLYCFHLKEQLLEHDGDNHIMKKVFDIYIFFLQVGQSEKLLQHVFAAIRAFIAQFPIALFQGSATLCGKLCYEILKCCSSHLSTTRNEACAILYLLMRGNYEFTKRKGITRVHLQVIISVSQLLGEVTGLNCNRFQESLSIINNYANSDKAMQANSFPTEVKDLTKRIRTVLMATMQMREHESDPEMLIDLQHSLANGYAATPELRKTWLESMAKIHKKNGDLSEAAFCYIHVAALIAEYLKQKGIFEYGCKAFASISPSILRDECSIKEDSGMQDTQYTEETLMNMLRDSAEMLDKAERYELIADIAKILIPIYERQRDYESLSECHKNLHIAYDKIIDVNKSGKRLLGKFYRVAFFGQSFFEEDAGKEYIYKEPKVTSLPEISERLYCLFCEKFGKDAVKMIMDSVTVDQKDLDPKYAYVQVTHVTPYFEEKELMNRVTEFERNNNICRFMFETPFVLGGKKARGALEEQCKRKTILATIYPFPYVKKRIAVFSKNVLDLSPIEVAIEEMETRVTELKEVITPVVPDLIKLQLKLQGSISVQVNAGPMAYASVFLDDKTSGKYPKEKVWELKEVYRNFVRVCGKALELNAKLINSDQHEYHEAMKSNFRELVNALSDMLHEKFYEEKTSSPGRNSLIFFNYISATPGSSTA